MTTLPPPSYPMPPQSGNQVLVPPDIPLLLRHFDTSVSHWRQAQRAGRVEGATFDGQIVQRTPDNGAGVVRFVSQPGTPSFIGERNMVEIAPEGNRYRAAIAFPSSGVYLPLQALPNSVADGTVEMELLDEDLNTVTYSSANPAHADIVRNTSTDDYYGFQRRIEVHWKTLLDSKRWFGGYPLKFFGTVMQSQGVNPPSLTLVSYAKSSTGTTVTLRVSATGLCTPPRSSLRAFTLDGSGTPTQAKLVGVTAVSGTVTSWSPDRADFPGSLQGEIFVSTESVTLDLTVDLEGYGGGATTGDTEWDNSGFALFAHAPHDQGGSASPLTHFIMKWGRVRPQVTEISWLALALPPYVAPGRRRVQFYRNRR